MTLMSLLDTVWAILPEKLLQIENIIKSHMIGDKLDLKKIEARILAFDGPAPKSSYDIVNGSAIIPIRGVLSNNPSAFERIFFDAVSMSKIRDDVKAAIDDPAVTQVVLDIDSPGGTMAGTQETARMIHGMRGNKKIIAHSSGMMASAAYYIGAAADKIYLSGDNVMAGSIGTIYRHIDQSKQNEAEGLTVTEFVSGKFKNAFSENQPLNKERSEYIQAIVDKSFETFAADLCVFRGIKQEQTGQGRVFLGKDAIEAGLVDGFASLEDIVRGEVAGARPVNQSKIAAQAAQNEVETMTLEELKAQFPDVYQSAVAEGKTSVDAEVKTAYEKGKSDELARVNGIKAALIPGHEKLIDALIADGSTVEAAMAAVIKAENDKRAGVLASIQAAAPAPVAASAPEPEPAEKDFEQMVAEHMTANKSSRGVAVAAVAREFPDIHAAYLEKINGGKK